MKCYRYNSVEDYVYHVKQLQKEGLNWCNSTTEDEYKPYFYEYSEFVLFVDEEDDFGQLSYGHPGWIDKGYELELYTRKNSNVNSY